MTNSALEQDIGYTFRDASLLELALTHRSLARELGNAHNQRLEFLGDAVLGMLIAQMLYALYPDANEGDLSKRLVSLVNGNQLAAIAGEMGIAEHLQLSNSEEEQGGRSNPSNMEDACEALLGAVYLDGGVDAARALVERFWMPYALKLTAAPKDAKTALQEWAQGRGLPLPEYVLVSAEGPAHAPDFVIEVQVQGCAPQRANAGNKRVAERLAAEEVLKRLPK